MRGQRSSKASAAEELDLDNFINEFKCMLSLLPVSNKTNVIDCWSNLHRARVLNWLSETNEDENVVVLDVEMASHYALGRNGNVHVLVQGKLLLFPKPVQLPDGQAWADTTEPERPRTQHFSAAFLAALLADSDLGMLSVARLHQIAGSDAAAFRERGLDVHDLALC